MSTHPTAKGVYGPGTFADVDFTPVPQECKRILKYLAEVTPGFTKDQALIDSVHFHGADYPLIPGPLKSQAFAAVLHAMAGIIGSEISALRGNKTGPISINTDAAALYPATPSLVTVDGKTMLDLMKTGEASKIVRDLDHGALDKNPMYYRSWSIYPTKDPSVYYQIMGSLHPPVLLAAFGLDPEDPVGVTSNDAAYKIIAAELGKYSAAELELKCMEKGLCGQTCYSPQAWRETLMGHLLGLHPLINNKLQKQAVHTPPVPFKTMANGDKRPLAGIKIVELARVIAAPAAGTALASFGADVVRIQSPNLPDPNPLQLTLTAGKRTCSLDLTNEDDKATLLKIMSEADVIIQAYRLGSLDRRGFGLDALLEIANKRGKGIIYLDLNCYGTDGYYAERPGWQQIADAASGCSYVCGKAYGFPEGVSVLPSLPIADMLSGATALVNVMLAVRERAVRGGSYYGNAALTAVDCAQVEEWMGLYSPEVVAKVQEAHQFGPMTPDLHVEDLLYVVVSAWAKTTDVLTREDIFVRFQETPFHHGLRMLAPLVRYENEEISPKWLTPPKPYCYDKEVRFAEDE